MDLTVYYKENEEQLLTVEEYSKLVRVTLNNPYYRDKDFNFDECEFKNKSVRMKFVSKLRKYNIKTEKGGLSGRLLVISTSTIPSLLNNILDSIIIKNNNDTNEYSIKQTKFQLEDLNGFITISEAHSMLNEITSNIRYFNLMKNILPAIYVPFISELERFLEKKSVIRFIKNIPDDNWVSVDEYLRLVRLELNMSSYTNFYFHDSSFETSSARQSFVNKIKKYGIEVKEHPVFLNIKIADKNTIPALVDKIFDNITVSNPIKENKYTPIKTKLESKDLDKFILTSEALAILGEIAKNKNTLYRMGEELPYIYIPFIRNRERFFVKENVLEFAKEETEKNSLVGIEEYFKLVKESLNNFYYMKIRLEDGKFNGADRQKYLRKISKYNVNTNRDRGYIRVEKSTVPTLVDSILNEIKINNNNKENEYYISHTKLEVEDLERFIARTDIDDFLGKHFKDATLSYSEQTSMLAKLPHICIPFISDKLLFFEKKSILDFANKRLENSHLVTLDKYFELLSMSLNYESEILSEKQKTLFRQKLEKYGVKIYGQSSQIKVDEKTLKPLVNKILSEATISKNDIFNEYKINEMDFKTNILKDCILQKDLKDFLGEVTNKTNVIDMIKKELPYILIPFINTKQVFYKKEILIKFVNEMRENGRIKEKKNIGSYKEKYPSFENKESNEEIVELKEVLNILKDTFPEIIGKSTLSKRTLITKISSYYPQELFISRGCLCITKNKVKEFINDTVKNILIINISEKYDIGGFMKYNITQEELDVDFINKHYVRKDYIEEMLGQTVSLSSLNKKVPRIKTDIISEVPFFRKEAIDHIKYIHETCIGKAVLAELLSEELGHKFSADNVFNIAKKEGLTVYYGPPGFYSTNTTNVTNVVSKKDMPRLREILEENILYEDCEDLYSYMKKFLDTKAKPTNKNIKKTLKYFNNYIIEINNTTRESSAKCIFRTCRQTYDLMNDYLTKDLFDYDEEELLELCDTVAGKYPDYVVERFRMFSNYVMDETGQKKKKLSRADDDKEKEKVLPYDLESYFTVLGTLIRFLSNKDDLINKIIDTKSRKNDSSLLYILTHYTACWRSADICAKLPNPNLRLIGFDSGEKFLEWFKKDDSVFTEDMGRLICKDVEYKITSTRACASKNNGKLLLYISPFLYKVYGLLLCICEAKRQRFNGESLLLKSTAKDLTETVNELDIEILESIGLFTNRRANKSFETYICERSEEWNMGIGYLMASVARGHKLNKQLFSETTRVYVNKDVDKMSFMAFSSSVFSGIKYEFLDLIDEDFKENTIEEKSVKATEFGLSNYELEIMLESIAQKQAVIDKFFKENLLNKNTKRKTVVQLFYGKNSTSKHEYAKCLLRAYISAENEEDIDLSKGFVKPCVYTGSKTCIGCPYLIAERYFLYELEIKLTEALNALESATSDFDKKIHLARLKDLFFPIVHEAMKELGAEYVKKVLSVDKMTSMYKQEKQALELKEKHGGMLNVGNHDCRRK